MKAKGFIFLENGSVYCSGVFHSYEEIMDFIKENLESSWIYDWYHEHKVWNEKPIAITAPSGKKFDLYEWDILKRTLSHWDYCTHVVNPFLEGVEKEIREALKTKGIYSCNHFEFELLDLNPDFPMGRPTTTV